MGPTVRSNVRSSVPSRIGTRNRSEGISRTPNDGGMSICRQASYSTRLLGIATMVTVPGIKVWQCGFLPVAIVERLALG